MLKEGDVFESDQISSPFVFGFLRPRIYLPFGLKDADLDYVLHHERCHIRRRDYLIKALSFLLLAAHWFNPLVWLSFFLLSRDMEQSCDEAVLSALEGPEETKGYGLCLLSFVSARRFPSVSPLSFGETGIASRVKNILRFRRPGLWVTLSAILICAAAVFALAANPDLRDETPPEIADLYGGYSFGEVVYLTPVSSFFPVKENMPYYRLDEAGLTIAKLTTNINDLQETIPLSYALEAVDEADFTPEDAFASFFRADLSDYRMKYRFASGTQAGGPTYCLYWMDGEIWLATGNPKSVLWSVYRLEPMVPLPTSTGSFGTAPRTPRFQPRRSRFGRDPRAQRGPLRERRIPDGVAHYAPGRGGLQQRHGLPFGFLCRV